MVKKLLSIAFAVILVAACQTGSMNKGGAGANGNYAPGSQGDLATRAGDHVLFDFDSSQITAEARETLAKQAEWLKQYNSANVTVEGHADERGTREYNLALGERRATSVKKALISLGVEAGRLQTISYGKERPAVDGHDEAAYAQNRRGVTTIN
jgi:peptidoglycan-associated lipoprotein